MKPKDVNDSALSEYSEEPNKKYPKFKIGHHVRISKYENIFSKGYTPNWSEEVFVVNKIQNTVPWTYLVNDLKGEQIKGSFYEKELQKTDQKELRIEKVIKRKEINHLLNGKVMIIILIVGLIKKTYYKMSYYLTDYKPRNSNVKVELDLKNYGTKKKLKNITHVDTSSFGMKTNLASLKTEVDKLDIPKLKTVPIDLADLTKEV